MYASTVCAQAAGSYASFNRGLPTRSRATNQYINPMRELFAHFGSVRVVSLTDRIDRRASFDRDVRDVGLSPRLAYQYFDAIRCADEGPFRKVGSHGAMLSHLAILRQGGPVLILQDDCKFMRVRFTPIDGNVDVFYGSHAHDAEEIIGCHCMGFSERGASLAADYLDRIYRQGPPNGHPFPYLPPIDGLFVWFRREHPELRTEFQLLATQRSSRSDVTPRRVDQVPGIRGAVNWARRVREDMKSVLVPREA